MSRQLFDNMSAGAVVAHHVEAMAPKVMTLAPKAVEPVKVVPVSNAGVVAALTSNLCAPL